MLTDIIVCGIAAAAFATLGVLLVNGQCLIIVTAYFAATPKQREAYDKAALGRFAGGLMFFFAVPHEPLYDEEVVTIDVEMRGVSIPGEPRYTITMELP